MKSQFLKACIIGLLLGWLTCLPAAAAVNVRLDQIEWGSGTDTTMVRSSAGNISVEGAVLLKTGGAAGTPSSITLTNGTGLPVSGITSSTSTALGVGSVELGHATDTTLSRLAAGKPGAEGVPLVLDTAEVDIASASTTDLGTGGSRHARITGTTTITSFGTPGAGAPIDVWGRFAGALTLTHNGTSLILPTAANIITVAGDMFHATSLGSGNWYVQYWRADGSPLKLNALYGSDGSTRLNVSYTAQAAGTTINFGTTGTRVLLDFTAGTPTDPTITLAAAGFYKVRAQVQVDYSSATITNQTMTLVVRRTNNTAADVSSVVPITLTPSTTLTYTYGTVLIPEFEYTASAGDILSIYGTLSGATGAGNITCVAAGTAITAVRLYE